MAPIIKPQGQRSSLAPFIFTFDTLWAPWAPLIHFKVPPKPPDFENVYEASSAALIIKHLGQRSSLAPLFSPWTSYGPPGPLKPP